MSGAQVRVLAVCLYLYISDMSPFSLQVHERLHSSVALGYGAVRDARTDLVHEAFVILLVMLSTIAFSGIYNLDVIRCL